MQEVKNSHDDAGPSSPPKPLASWYAQGLSDGLGDRLLMFDNSGAPSLELLRFRPEFAEVPGFETALRERVHRLGQFRHPAFARVRAVQRLEPDNDLALVSNCTEGKRLSEVLHRARGPAFASALIKQLAPALALLQQHDAGISHGVLSPDRIVVSPDGRLTIVEHVVGGAIEALNLRTAELASLGIALPPASNGGSARLDVATDWYQLGLAAVSVLIGRPVTPSELPQLETLLDRMGHPAGGDGTTLSPFIRQWLERALQISGNGIESAAEGRAVLDELLQKERPRESRRIESPRRDQAAAEAPARASETGPPAEPVVLTPVQPPAAPVLTDEPPPFEVHAPSEARRRPPQLLRLFDEESSAAKKRRLDTERAAPEQHVLTRPRLLDPRPATRSPVYDPHAAMRTPVADAQAAARPHPPAAGRRTVSLSVAAALALIAVAEAGVIAGLARAVWRAPHPAIAVETSASGENVLVSSRSTDAAPLRLVVAPDMRWVRVTSPSSEAAFGAKGASPADGTIRISSPIELKVFEQSRLVGFVPGAPLKLSAGRHEIELVNVALGYRLRQALDVEPGQSLSLHVAPPHGWVTVDAAPWAEVTIDGQAVGRTPLGPLPLALGEHQVTFRNPAGSNDRQRVTVKSDAVTRVIGVLRF